MKKKMVKDKQTNIWGKIPEVEEDKRIMEIMWKLGGGFKEDKENIFRILRYIILYITIKIYKKK